MCLIFTLNQMICFTSKSIQTTSQTLSTLVIAESPFKSMYLATLDDFALGDVADTWTKRFRVAKKLLYICEN